MARTLKVYSWITPGDVVLADGRRQQLRVVMSARSKAELMRESDHLGVKYGPEPGYVAETANPHSVAAGLAAPLTALACPVNDRSGELQPIEVLLP